MKHAANRTQTTVKAKTKTLAQVKAVKKIKPAAKQPVSKAALKPRSQKPIEKAEVAAKAGSKNSSRVAKPTAKQTASKLSAKTLSALKTLSIRKDKPAVKRAAQPKAKRIEMKTTVKTIKVSTTKAKPIASTKKVSAAAKTVKKIAAPQKAKFSVAPTKPKVSRRASAKNPIKTAKSQSSKLDVLKTKERLPKVENAAPAAKIKAARQKAKLVAAARKSKNTGKTKPVVAAQPAKRKKIAPTVPAKRVDLKSKKIQPVVQAKKTVVKATKIKPLAVTAKKVVKRTQKFKPAISAATFGKPNRTIKKVVSIEKSKAATNAVEAIQPPAPKPKNRKARPISSAVFRGKKERYDFKVFALNEKFEPIPAVYIISKRKTDRNKRGHHALICIGETSSISDELKRHRKGKCVKKHEANVVSILPEADAKVRLKIETDLKAAHAVVCNLD